MQYANMNLMAPLTVKAVGADGRPLGNVPLKWTVTSGAGTLVYPQLTTDANGQASSVFRGDVQPGYSYSQQAVTVSSSIGSVTFTEITGISRLPNGSMAALPMTQLMSPPSDDRTIVGEAGAIIPAAVVLGVFVQGGFQSGQPVPNVEFHMVDGVDYDQPAKAQCVTPAITGTDGIAKCDLLLTSTPGTYAISAKVGEVNITPAILVTVHPTPPPPPPPAATPVVVTAVTNAATFQTGPVSPGEIVTLFGTNIGPATLAGMKLTVQGLVDTSIADTQVLFDSVPAPLIYVSSTQVSVIVPYNVSGRSSTQVRIAYKGTQSASLTIPVTASAPGLFTLNASGTGPAAALNQDGSVNTADNGIEPGSIVVLYATGEGDTDPKGVDGKPALTQYPQPVLPVSVKFGGVPAEVLYAGAAPEMVAGVLQINARVPVGFPSRTAIPVVVTVGGASSQANVTIATK